MSKRILHQPRGPPSVEYHRGMFIDTVCEQAKVQNYMEMYSSLKLLADNYEGVKLISCGKSEGFGGPENALDVWGLHIFATDKSERTVFIVGGHHLGEDSGSVTAHLIGKRLLESYQSGNTYVQSMMRNTHTVVIPQVNADYYDNLDVYDRTPRDRSWTMEQKIKDHYRKIKKYWLKASGTFTDAHGSKNRTYFRIYEPNFYGDPLKYLALNGYPPLEQALSVKRTVESCIQKYGRPFLALDFHEDWHDQFMIAQYGKESIVKDEDGEIIKRSISLPRYALEEVEKSHPFNVEHNEAHYGGLDIMTYTFSHFLAKKGAMSFLFETSEYIELEKRIEMSLIGVDRILARKFLGI